MFKAIGIDKADSGQTVALTDFDEAELMEGDVTVRVEYSTLNYKDGLALTGKAPVVRRFPMIAGIDFAGTVETLHRIRNGSRATRSSCNGWGVGETHLGAYAEKARVKGDWLVRLPAGHDRRARRWRSAPPATPRCSRCWRSRSTASRRSSGPIVVTGAAGGVGSVAIALLAKLGYHVIASTGRPQEADYLKGLGAAEIIDRNELAGPGQAARPRSAGPAAIDASARPRSPTCCR